MTVRPEPEGSILLVDDEEDIRDVLGITLADMGYTILPAENGKAALDIFQKEQPAIVLTDIKMPIMDGIELLRQIKRINPETEVVMITGHGDMDLAVKSLKYKASDFITKPINVDALEIALKRVQEKILMRTKLREYTEHLETLVREKSQLQDHLSSLGLMIGSISHGIKGLLTGLDGGMYLLDSGFEKNDSRRIEEGWQTVKLMIERIRKMVLDILFYAKDRDLERRVTDVLVFCKDVSGVFTPHLSKHKVAFITEFDPSPGTFEVDADLLRSALVNILENAVDACLRESSRPKHRVVFSAGVTPSEVVFTVADDGIGMNLETREKIFTLFFSSKGTKGTGLGLFIANHIVRQHGGHIAVTSTPGKGSLFTVTIPRRAAASGPGSGNGQPAN